MKVSFRSLILVMPLLMTTACSQFGTSMEFEQINSLAAEAVDDGSSIQDVASPIPSAPKPAAPVDVPSVGDSDVPECDFAVLDQSNIHESMEIAEGTLLTYQTGNSAIKTCIISNCETVTEVSISQ
ncbi:hypothetical protein [Bdellovibrio sp. HCB288]|uniref:hypothetical protein n=1 Tax=Bdellovibrio sp. HCB288 TaxID=3394355 RepID=UPI0039B46731